MLFERPEQGERAMLLHVKFHDPRISTDFVEFVELAKSAGANVLIKHSCFLKHISPGILIGSGQLENIIELIALHKIELLLVNYKLSATQEKNLEKACCCRVIDRAGLILDIFAQRARTFEGKLQVELAQLKHLSTRLIKGWTHLERQKGGIGLRGPGETQLELDRRLLRQRVKTITAKLVKIKQQRNLSRLHREKSEMQTIALVGYTNSGKSTLFKQLTKDQDIYVADQLFATLDPTLRRIDIPVMGQVILADTVGFVRDLPHDLVEAFKATLEETKSANLLLHVIDCHDILWQEKKIQVDKVLHQIGALNVPVLEVYNKIDKLNHINMLSGIEKDHLGNVSHVRISAKQNIGLDELLIAIAERLCKEIIKGCLVVDLTQAKLRARLYELGAVEQEVMEDSGRLLINISLHKERWQKLVQEYKLTEDCLIQLNTYKND